MKDNGQTEHLMDMAFIPTNLVQLMKDNSHKDKNMEQESS